MESGTAERRRLRSSRLIIAEPPGGPDCWKPGHCAWCGEEIVILDPVASYRQRQRTRHRGDEHEAGDRNCHREFNLSTTWKSRTAVRRRDFAEKGAVVCVDCGTVNEEAPSNPRWAEAGAPGKTLVAWDADHDVPLEDEGEHVLANLRARCAVPCHRDKTAREARERAERRRKK